MADEFAKFQDITRNTMEYAAKNNISFKSSKKFRVKSFVKFQVRYAVNQKTPEYMAEMLVVSNIIGLIDIKKALKECSEANEDVKALAYSLIDVLNSNIQEMLSFV